MNTICAISTPAAAAGAISLIRMSGEDAVSIADGVFSAFSAKRVSDMKGHTCAYGRIIDEGKTVDDVLLTVFRAPKSYTGEDTVEISCHGGSYVTRRILGLLVKNGAVPAAPGEFTKRAVLNGKLTLTQAEAVMDIISSEGERALISANNMREGAVFKRITEVREKLVAMLGSLAAWVDYPDDDIPSVDEQSIRLTLCDCIDRLSALIKSFDDGIVFREGVLTAIVGLPNVGKSSVMNMLLGFDRSIVTDIEGTTRDVVEESARLGDIVLRLCDTAGLRETNDAVESIGVSLSKKTLSSARLVLAVFDISRELSDSDKVLLSSLSPKNTVIILNKSDLGQKLDTESFTGFLTVVCSAKERTGTDELKSAVEKLLCTDGFSSQETVFASERQKSCASRACVSLKAALDALNNGETLDAVTAAADGALSPLLELTGEKASETVLNEVFSRFCVGK